MRTESVASLLLLLAVSDRVLAQSGSGEWRAYGHDDAGTRYAPLTQITRDNVARLAVTWTYHTGETERDRFPVKRDPRFEATPLMVDGTLYLSTPMGRVIALDPVTGHERWIYDAKINVGAGWGDFANRGVSTWLDAAAPRGAPCRRRIYLGTVDAQIVALDARTGTPCHDFGASGRISLRRGLRNAPFQLEEYALTSPPAVIRGLIVTGSSVADNNRTSAASGEVRAFDARTGALRWSWDPVPRDSSDAQWESWRGPMAHTTGAANAWSVIAADSARDLVFVPTGSPSPDYFGGERVGDNHYANSVVALRASTGAVVWHFQAVHHDLWDYDVASPPTLATITHDGRRVDVVLQATKTGQLFVLDRDSGTPVFPVEERAVPPTHVLGERASPTQPFNTVLPALSPQSLPIDEVWGPTPADREACLAQIRPLRNEGIFTPPSLDGTVVMPSNVGGAHWGGLAVDPTRQVAVIPVNRLVAFVQLIPLDRLDTAEASRNSARLDDQYTRMHGTPFVMRRRMLLGPSKLPCSRPPFGSLVAIDLQRGVKLWDVPLGDVSRLAPNAASRAGGTGDTRPELGSPNLGGPMITAGGVVFVAATFDRTIRAFDVETGRKLWEASLPAGARATPMTYQLSPSGKQYLVIAAGGGEEWGKGDAVIAFALP
ncbi:MAG: Pyrrolo-quinoline quinone beta-propeller repeat-containing protein [Gemmatimonadetes bacterium]|nr:Pyrrolo-quinoline quinone beta-propeller repeat-containing protein [Gemmatimonadota bacterium]